MGGSTVGWWWETRTRLGGPEERGGVRGAWDFVGRHWFQEARDGTSSIGRRGAVDIGDGSGEGGRRCGE